jgi:hypothetical protein
LPRENDKRLKMEGLNSGNCCRVREINKPDKRDGGGDDDDENDDYDDDDTEAEEEEETDYPCA